MITPTVRRSLFGRAANLLFLVVLLAGTGAASEISWDVVGTFRDGGSLTGWVEFSTTATNDVASDFSLTVNGGNTSLFPDFTFTPSDSTSGGGFRLSELVFNSANGYALIADFSSSFTAASADPNQLLNGTEFAPDFTDNRDLTSGSATLEPVAPEPGSLALMATALAGLMVALGFRRLKLRRTGTTASGSIQPAG